MTNLQNHILIIFSICVGCNKIYNYNWWSQTQQVPGAVPSNSLVCDHDNWRMLKHLPHTLMFFIVVNCDSIESLRCDHHNQQVLYCIYSFTHGNFSNSKTQFQWHKFVYLFCIYVCLSYRYTQVTVLLAQKYKQQHYIDIASGELYAAFEDIYQ